jgi:methyl-accepting chemotaxis protein
MKKVWQNFLIRILSALSVVFLVLGLIFVAASYFAGETLSSVGVITALIASILAIVSLVSMNFYLLELTARIKEAVFIAEKISRGEIFYTSKEKTDNELKIALGRISENFVQRMELIEKMAFGNLDLEVELYSDSDAFGQALQNTIAKLKTQVQTKKEREEFQKSIQNLLAKTSQIINGDFSAYVTVSNSNFEPVAKAFNSMAKELNDLMAHVKRLSSEISASARRINEIAAYLEHENDTQIEQSSQWANVYSNLQIRKIFEKSSLAVQTSGACLSAAIYAVKAVQEGLDSINSIRLRIQETVKRVKKLGEHSQEIAQTVDSISDASHKIELLALNLNLYSVSHSEDKKKSAVVAREAEMLAGNFSHLARQMETLVQTAQSQLQEVIVSMEQTIQEVIVSSTFTNRILQMLSEIERASIQLNEVLEEISVLITQSVQAAEDISRLAGGFEKSARIMKGNIKQVLSSAAELVSYSNELVGVVGDLKTIDTESPREATEISKNNESPKDIGSGESFRTATLEKNLK